MKPAKYVEMLSLPIRCVSKPEQIRKKVAEHEGATLKPSSKKRARSEELIEVLQEISNTQTKHSNLLQQLLKSPSSLKLSNLDQKSLSLDGAFELLLKCWNSEIPAERPTKLRKIYHKSSQHQEMFEEISAALSSSQTSDDELPNLSTFQEDRSSMSPTTLDSSIGSPLDSSMLHENEDFQNWLTCEEFLQ